MRTSSAWQAKETRLLEFCAGSYLILAIFAGIFVWSACIVAKRADQARHAGLAFWIAATAAEQAKHTIHRLDEKAEKVDLQKTVPYDV